MRPPICAICGKDFRADLTKGGSVTFTLTEADKESKRKLEKSGMVGHPAACEWFCQRHLKAAKKYSHLSLQEALEKMRT